jgi:hypothetical protein
MKIQFQAPLLDVSHHLSPWCALLVLTTPARFQPPLKVSPRPMQTPTKPVLPTPLLTPLTCSQSLSSKPNTY